MSVQLIIAQVMLMLLGMIGVAAARPDLIVDHGVKTVIALMVTFVVSRFSPRQFLNAGTAVWGVTLFFLILVLFVGVGAEHSAGTRRWLDFGVLRFQPSELAKLGLVLQLASFFARRGAQRKLVSATLMISVTTGLILLEPDLGTSVLTFGLGIVLMYAAGVRISNIAGFTLALGLFGLPWIASYLERHQYIIDRILGHVNRDEVLEKGLDQIGMAHRDLTLGGWWGHGPDGLRWEYFAAHTDLVVAAIGFSMGLLGVAMLLFAYWLIVGTALRVSRLATRIVPMSPDVHGASTLAIGCMFMIVGQAVTNLGVAAGILPVTGVPLPLVSYGFSSALTMSIAMGIIHSAMREIRAQLPEAIRHNEDDGDLVAVASD